MLACSWMHVSVCVCVCGADGTIIHRNKMHNILYIIYTLNIYNTNLSGVCICSVYFVFFIVLFFNNNNKFYDYTQNTL